MCFCSKTVTVLATLIGKGVVIASMSHVTATNSPTTPTTQTTATTVPKSTKNLRTGPVPVPVPKIWRPKSYEF